MSITFDPVEPLDEITFGIQIEAKYNPDWKLGDGLSSDYDTYCWFYGSQGDARFLHPDLGGADVTLTID